MFTKKDFLYIIISTIVVLAAIMGKVYITEMQQSQLRYTPGTYKVSAEGYHGPITLEVTFDSCSITNIEMLEESETEEIGHRAIPVLIDQIMKAQGVGVDGVTGATITCSAIQAAICKAAEMAHVSSLEAFKSRKSKNVKAEDIEDTWDIVVIGGGGAGLAAAAQAAQDGNSVLVIEKSIGLGGNTIISGGVYQSVTPYLVWEANNPDATKGKGYDGKMYDKMLAVNGNITTLKTILNWSEKPFDAAYYLTHEFVAGDEQELSRHGVHKEYLQTLIALKKEIRNYLSWAEKQMAKGKKETQLTLFSTNNLHIFQTYYGGLRMSNDKKDWCYGNATLVRQFVEEGQKLRPWLTGMGVDFTETQGIIVGGLWYRSNRMNGANVTIDGKSEFYQGNKGIYVMAPYAAIVNADKHNKVMTLTSAEDLIIEKGRVCGVNALCDNGAHLTAHARKGVIIATGGYAANVKMVVETNRYWAASDLQSSTKTTNRSTLQGDGIVMAQKIGAGVTGMGWTQLMPLSFQKTGSIAFGGIDNSVLITPKNGKRYVDELSERDVLCIAAFKNGIKMQGSSGVHFYISGLHSQSKNYGPMLPDKDGCQYSLRVSELPGFLKKLGFDVDGNAIINTIKDYDMAIMTGKQPKDVGKRYAVATIGESEKKADGSFDISSYRLNDSEIMLRILAPATHHTMGGLTVDTERRVLDKSGNPIPGLFAAGEVTGGIHGGNRLGGNALTEILVSGRIAARSAGREK